MSGAPAAAEPEDEGLEADSPEPIEPQLKYEPLQGDVPGIVVRESITVLCLSDKILAVGTDAGRTHVLDYSGNQVKQLQHHKSAVADLSFDAAGEHLASCGADGVVIISSLYSDTIVRYDYTQPVQAIALDPRYGSRKTREVAVLLANSGSVQLSSQGWLGRSDATLFKGPGTQLVRWWGHLIAWVTGSSLTVYSTVQHQAVRELSRPANGRAAAYAHASLLWGQNGYLYASWPDCVQVCRTFSVENNVGLSSSQVEVVVQWQPEYLVLGVSPFGRDLAVLTFQPGWGAATPGSTTAHLPDGTHSRTPKPPGSPREPDTPQQPCLELRITTLQGGELAHDELHVGPLLTLLPGGRSPYTLVPSLPATTTAATAANRRRDHAAATAAVLSRPSRGSTQPQAASPPTGATSRLASAVASPRATIADGVGPTPASPGTLSRSSSGGLSSVRPARRRASLPGPPLPSIHDPDYEEDAEFMYFISTDKAVLVGRQRDISDHASWLCGQAKWEAALQVLEARRREVRPDVADQVVQGYIGDLLSRGAWEEAAVLSPRLLQNDGPLWERWAFMFASARQLPLLADVLPTANPKLSGQIYDMVMQALLANAQDHATALRLAKSWPMGTYSAPALVDAAVARMKRGGPGADTRELWLLLSHLYEGQGRPDLALSILLQLRDPAAFQYLAGRHEGLLARLTPKRLTQLLELDPPRATRMLVKHMDVVPPARVVQALQEAMTDAETGEETEVWRRGLWSYLAAVHDVDPAAAAPFAELQVALTADYAPGKLRDLLGSASNVPLEAALAICEDKGLIGEQVFILGRMGNALRALHLIIDRLADIPQAIAFVEGQGDEELWEQLISWALSSPDTTGALLDHIGGHLNPLALIRRIPSGLTIPRLRDRIRSIIADFRTQTSLREGCNVILRTDCARLVTRLTAAAAAAVSTVYLPPNPGTARRMEGKLETWARLEDGKVVPQPLPALEEVPPIVQQAGAAVVAASRSSSGGGQAAARDVSHFLGSGGGAARAARPPSVWVGCLPPVSSEDMSGAASPGGAAVTPIEPSPSPKRPASGKGGGARRGASSSGASTGKGRGLGSSSGGEAAGHEPLPSLIMY